MIAVILVPLIIGALIAIIWGRPVAQGWFDKLGWAVSILIFLAACIAFPPLLLIVGLPVLVLGGTYGLWISIIEPIIYGLKWIARKVRTLRRQPKHQEAASTPGNTLRVTATIAIVH